MQLCIRLIVLSAYGIIMTNMHLIFLRVCVCEVAYDSLVNRRKHMHIENMNINRRLAQFAEYQTKVNIHRDSCSGFVLSLILSTIMPYFLRIIRSIRVRTARTLMPKFANNRICIIVLILFRHPNQVISL